MNQADNTYLNKLDEDIEQLKQVLNSMLSASHPSYVQDVSLHEKLIKARDNTFRALVLCRLNAKERHKTTENHIPDTGKTIAPYGSRLVKLADIDAAIQRASVFDDSGDGADPESARSCIEILRGMISGNGDAFKALENSRLNAKERRLISDQQNIEYAVPKAEYTDSQMLDYLLSTNPFVSTREGLNRKMSSYFGQPNGQII